jgi:sulfate adenylyltransferase subunit 1 (EFTu-like GTPase family)
MAKPGTARRQESCRCVKRWLPIFALPFAQHHESGRLILIDERTNTTAGAALIV